MGGASVAPGAERPPMVQAALSSLFAGTYQMLAAQEIASTNSAQFLRTPRYRLAAPVVEMLFGEFRHGNEKVNGKGSVGTNGTAVKGCENRRC